MSMSDVCPSTDTRISTNENTGLNSSTNHRTRKRYFEPICLQNMIRIRLSSLINICHCFKHELSRVTENICKHYNTFFQLDDSQKVSSWETNRLINFKITNSLYLKHFNRFINNFHNSLICYLRISCMDRVSITGFETKAITDYDSKTFLLWQKLIMNPYFLTKILYFGTLELYFDIYIVRVKAIECEGWSQHSSLIFQILLFTKPNIEVSGWLYQTKTHFTHIVYQPFSIVSPPSFTLYGSHT